MRTLVLTSACIVNQNPQTFSASQQVQHTPLTVRNRNIARMNIAQRVSWALKRNATNVEDEAHCRIENQFIDQFRPEEEQRL